MSDEKNKPYMAALLAGKQAESAGRLTAAHKHLSQARRLTSDDDEIEHLNVWIARLQRQIAGQMR